MAKSYTLIDEYVALLVRLKIDNAFLRKTTTANSYAFVWETAYGVESTSASLTDSDWRG